MAGLPMSAVQLLTSGANAHLVTLNTDGSPQLSMVWPGVDGDEIVVGHLRFHQKLRNVERDPRVVLSVEAPTANAIGLRDYLVLHGRARVVAGGAPELLAQLAPRFLPAGTAFPPADAPAGWVLRIAVDRIGGSGPWTRGELTTGPADSGGEATEPTLEHLEDLLDLGRRFPITVDANVLDHGRDLALRAVEPCGVRTSVSGGAASRSTVPLQQMYLKGLRYEIGRVHAMATAPAVVELVRSGRLDPGAVVTRMAPFSDAVDAMVDPTVKVVFVNDLAD